MRQKTIIQDVDALVRSLGKGSVEAFDSLYGMFHAKVEKVARILLAGHFEEATAKDIKQAVFLKVWEKRSLIASTVQDFDSYLFRMTKNETLNYLSRKAKDYQVIGPDFQAPSSNSVISEIEAMETERLIDMALEEMPQQRRKAFLMSRIGGLTYKDIAREMDISSKTVEKHISSALKDLKKTLS